MSGEERRAAFDDLRATLAHAQSKRRQRDHIVNGKPAWIAYELAVMTDRVNLLRLRLGLSPLPGYEIERAEQQACGHVDYSMKWALYCAELATTTTRPGDVRGTDHTKETGDE